MTAALGDGHAAQTRPVCKDDDRLLWADRMKGRGEVSFSVNDALLSGSALNPDAGRNSYGQTLSGQRRGVVSGLNQDNIVRLGLLEGFRE